MSDASTLTPGQCRAARAFLGWSRSELAAHSLVGISTISDFESNKRSPNVRTLNDVRQTLEKAGVAFQAADTLGGPGVRLSAKV